MSRIGPTRPASVELSAGPSITDLLWVANTRHGPGGHWFARVTSDRGDHDHLATVDDASAYLTGHRVALPDSPPQPADLTALVAIREMVRGLLEPANAWTPEVLGILARARFELDMEGRLLAAGGDWEAFVGNLMLPLLELVRLRERLSICGNPFCRLVFLDGSKSRTRRWCDDAGCGNRDRVQRHRGRARTRPDLDMRIVGSRTTVSEPQELRP
jgi:predicted RNA-binding Zn ribbon-like protein